MGITEIDQIIQHVKDNSSWNGTEDLRLIKKALTMLESVEGVEVSIKGDLLDPMRFVRNLTGHDKMLVDVAMEAKWPGIAVPYLVRTPDPYVVCLKHYRNEAARHEAIERLNKSVEELDVVLSLLGITREDAAERKYTLNLDTRHRLMDVSRYGMSTIEDIDLAERCQKVFHMLNKSESF